jgi:hypothetical protein
LPHEFPIAEERPRLLDKARGVDYVLGEEVHDLEKFVVRLSVLKSMFNAVEEVGLVV